MTSTLYLPTVECRAGICLFILVISTSSKSTIVILPTPALAKASTVKLPTPPTPNTIIFELLSFLSHHLQLEN
ncbi:hypothetical protein QKA_3178 [Clostridioides difficile DA00165]|nr:hypothetical protein QKA_3178 [Clostridioides difficile DA00165]